ncbi:hypothetical protein MCHI_002286 [Candidatus Magnetoovum chiemensis]|nr:hypothetical protein MCHI_002286 [Candidatus Magnetoovum chiemensis]
MMSRRLSQFTRNTSSGLSFNRPLNTGAMCSSGVPLSSAVCLRSTITQAGRGSVSTSKGWLRPMNSGCSS